MWGKLATIQLSLESCLLVYLKNVKIKIHRTLILPAIL
jgi:hypothetical protein